MKRKRVIKESLEDAERQKRLDEAKKCSACSGSGRYKGGKCGWCGGTGLEPSDG